MWEAFCAGINWIIIDQCCRCRPMGHMVQHHFGNPDLDPHQSEKLDHKCKCTVSKIRKKYSQKWNCAVSFPISTLCARFVYRSENAIQQNRRSYKITMPKILFHLSAAAAMSSYVTNLLYVDLIKMLIITSIFPHFLLPFIYLLLLLQQPPT